MTLHSGAYVGVVKHHRREPAHAFTFPLFMMYLDLAELDEVFEMTRLWGTSRLCPARFCPEDYLQHNGLDLDPAVRATVERAIGRRPTGPIRMLTHLRFFGYTFNPVTFYYCFSEHGSLAALVAEITNTPWGERHRYVLDADLARPVGTHGIRRWRFDKDFHVSPFLPMNLRYDWSFDTPGETLYAHMNLQPRRNASARVFNATLKMSRRELTPGLLRGLLLRYPLMTAQVVGKIHFEALRLWLKKTPIFPHPHRSRPHTPAVNPERN